MPYACDFDPDDAMRIAEKALRTAYRQLRLPRMRAVEGRCLSQRHAGQRHSRPAAVVRLRDGRKMSVHLTRIIWEAIHGPLLPTQVVDHLCMNGWCINPDHLDACSPSMNTKRAYAAHGMKLCNKIKPQPFWPPIFDA